MEVMEHKRPIDDELVRENPIGKGEWVEPIHCLNNDLEVQRQMTHM